jgi:uncharacterized protein
MEKLNKPPVVVLDTNVFLVSLALQSDYAPIFDSLVEGHFDMVVSTEILAEYEEIIGQRYDKQTVNDIFELFLNLPNIIKKEHSYRFLLIEADADDDKFSDIAIASNADLLVTDDKHFNILKKIGFPKVPTIKAKEFVEFCLAQQKV